MRAGDGSPRRKSSGEMNDRVSYISKEKYTALAAEIRKWEDDLRHTRYCINSSGEPTSTDKTPDSASKRSRVRESLASVTSAHVSSLRKFWEGLMTQENLSTTAERQPLRSIQLHALSSEGPRILVAKTAQTCTESLQTGSPDPGNPELPPPPLGVGEEQLLPMAGTPQDLPSPPPLDDIKQDAHSKSADFIELPASPKGGYFVPECPSTVQPIIPHRYYDRPRLGATAFRGNGGAFCHGALRNWPNSSNLNETPPALLEGVTNAQLPRQRSVTFEPKIGSAPGDTEVDTEVDAKNTNSSSFRGHSPILNTQREQYNYLNGESVGIFESAARLANSADRFDRNRRRLQRSSIVAGLSSDTDQVESIGTSTSEGSSDDDTSDVESVNSEPIGNHPSFKAVNTTPISPSSSRGRKSSEVPRRVSREASALLDFDCPPTPSTREGRLSRSNTEIAAAEAATMRRLERMKNIADLLTHEKSLIMELSAELTELHSATTTTAFCTGKSSKSSVMKDAPVNIGEAAVVDLNRRFLLACQRRQALLEELSLLHKGSMVLVPPMRGEPLRAHFQLHAVRVALKSDPTFSSCGYVVVPLGEEPRSWVGRPVKYHILAVLKCVGEGRIYHTQTVTIMRVDDLHPGTSRAVPFVDLVADIDIVPLRPDFVINIEIYCLKTGGTGGGGGSGNIGGGGGAPTERHQPPGFHTPVSKRVNLSFFEDSPLTSSAKRCGGFRIPSLLSSKKKKYSIPRQAQTNDLSAAFTLLSSVSIRHHDDLLFGRLPRGTFEDGRRELDTGEGISVDAQGADVLMDMPLYLDGLPRSSPLAGPLGLDDVAVRLQSAVLKRGFLTVFEESGGMGVWNRCWCKLSADQLVYWRYPEDEMEAATASSSASSGPVGRLDLRRIVAPWAVQAPRKICVRANTIYMRSLAAVNPKTLLFDATSSESAENAATSSSASAISILLRASPDYKWMEQRHLICADSESEMTSWMKQLNRALEVLQRWMPEHFARLARYDSSLTFTQPVAASVASRFKR